MTNTVKNLIPVAGLLLLWACSPQNVEEPVVSGRDGKYYYFNVCCNALEPSPKSTVRPTSLTKITDVNVFVYCDSSLVDSYYFPSADSQLKVFLPSYSSEFDLYMLANVGKQKAPSSESDLKYLEIKFRDYSDFEKNGFPMVGTFPGYKPGSCDRFSLMRLVGMFRLSMQTKSQDASYEVKSVRLRNCAENVWPFGNRNADSFLDIGDSLSAKDVGDLNSGKEVELYFLENRQSQDHGSKRTYLQIEAEVSTPAAHYDNVTYRVYLGKDFSILRNTLYNLTVNFISNKVTGDGWMVDPDAPEVVGDLILSKNEACVIRGVDDVIFVRSQSRSGSEVGFRVVPGEGASRAGIQFTVEDNVLYHGLPHHAIRFSTSLPIDGFLKMEDEADCISVPFKVVSDEEFGGEPLISRELEVKVYHQVFPICLKAEKIAGKISAYRLLAYSNNPMRLPLGIRTDIYRMADFRWTLRTSSVIQASRYSEGVPGQDGWLEKDNTLGFGGQTVAQISSLSDFIGSNYKEGSNGLIVDLSVFPVDGSNLSYYGSNSVCAEHPMLGCRSLYMGEGTGTSFGPGLALAPTSSPTFSADAKWEQVSDGTLSAGSSGGFSYSLTSGDGALLMAIDSSTTGWNRQNSYSFEGFSGSPFYFCNTGLTVYEAKVFNDKPRYLDDSGRIGIVLKAYEPGCDIGLTEEPSTCEFGYLLGTMTQFLGNVHTFHVWHGYKGKVFLQINGCSSWPNPDYL